VGLQVSRGAPCGATWDAVSRVVGLSVGEALTRIGLETQYFCTANPAGWDPLYGKSPVHFAGDVHKAALRRALAESSSDQGNVPCQS
jgi:thymidylate synthase